MGKTSIEWCDYTFNIGWGCTKVSPACQNCYAEKIAHRFGVAWGPKAERKISSDEVWDEPNRWNRKAIKNKTRYSVFASSMADVFEFNAAWNRPRADLWALCESLKHLDWLLLTKRPENVMDMVPKAWHRRFPSNVWLGVTAENQEWLDKRMYFLKQIPATVRFLSCEPLLGPLELTWHKHAIDWVICGGESGRKARRMEVEWARDLRNQCQFWGIPFFFKQWGPAKSAGRMLDGRTWDEKPQTKAVEHA